jgi:hypothetical protein
MTGISDPPPISPAAERMRRSRERRRNGLRYLGIELCETEIEALVRMGFLAEVARHNDGEVIVALCAFLDFVLCDV